MGTWGTDLYEDDTACDVRDAFVAGLQAGLSGQAAATRVLAPYRALLDTPQVACCVYFALADTAWRQGHLTDAVRSTALALIESGGDAPLWARDAPRDLPARQATLQRLAARLRSAQPPARAVAPAPEALKTVHTEAPVGSVFVLGLPDGGRAALVMVGFKDLGHSLDPVFTVSAWRGSDSDLPPTDRLATMGTLSMPSFRKRHAHVAVIPPDGRQGFMSRLQRVGGVAGLWPFEPADVIWLSLGRIAREIHRQQASTP